MAAYSTKNAEASLAKIKKAFGKLSDAQVSGFRFLLSSPQIEGALITQVAYMLATVWHETAKTMQPIAEYGGEHYANSRYDPVLATTPARRQRARAMGNTQKGDGYKYRGRGYVQLTWKGNYARMGELLSVDLVNKPELAMQPDIALAIMIRGMRDGLFTGAKLSTFVNNERTNYTSARSVINGTDKAALIAGYAAKFAACLVP